jgi:hypothetical protein
MRRANPSFGGIASIYQAIAGRPSYIAFRFQDGRRSPPEKAPCVRRALLRRLSTATVPPAAAKSLVVCLPRAVRQVFREQFNEYQ